MPNDKILAFLYFWHCWLLTLNRHPIIYTNDTSGTIFQNGQEDFAKISSYNTGITHWGRVTHICVSKLIIIGSDNGLLPGRRQAIIWTNAGLLLIGPLGTNFSEILIEILTFSFEKMRLKVSSAERRPFCLDLNVIKACNIHKWNFLTTHAIEFDGKSQSILNLTVFYHVSYGTLAWNARQYSMLVNVLCSEQYSYLPHY